MKRGIGGLEELLLKHLNQENTQTETEQRNATPEATALPEIQTEVSSWSKIPNDSRFEVLTTNNSPE